MKEVDSGEGLLEYYVGRVKALPKIPVDDPRVLSGGGHRIIQFGNNFFQLWVSLQADIPHGRAIDIIYRDKAQRLEEWGTFTATNAELLERVRGVLLDTYQPYAEVEDWAKDRSNQQDWEAYRALQAAAEHPFGLEALETYVWDRMNPVLEEVAVEMVEAGIDPTQFYS